MINIIPIRALKDNYIWIIAKQGNKNCICIDPGESQPVITYLKNNQLNLSSILITHHHFDHTGGINDLVAHFSCSVYAHNAQIASNLNNELSHINTISLEKSQLDCEVIKVPGHTLDHVCYKIEDNLFTGDTLFSAGCGRLFEGTIKQLFDSLMLIKNLPDDTKIYCGHEYTYKNLRFARDVAPNNKDIENRYNYIEKLQNENKITLPSTIGTEKKTNVFFMSTQPDIINAVNEHFNTNVKSELDVFRYLRLWKDSFN